MFTELRIASFNRLAFWNSDLEVDEIVEGGPLGGNDGVNTLGEDMEEALAEFDPVYERLPEELELADPSGLETDVVLRVTVRLLGFETSDIAVVLGEAPVKVKV
jgi:hypothetical protein